MAVCGVCYRDRADVDWSLEYGAVLCDPCYRARCAVERTRRARAADRAAIESEAHIKAMRREGVWQSPRLTH